MFRGENRFAEIVLQLYHYNKERIKNENTIILIYLMFTQIISNNIILPELPASPVISPPLLL